MPVVNRRSGGGTSKLKTVPPPTPQTPVLREQMAMTVNRFNRTLRGVYGVLNLDLRHNRFFDIMELDITLCGPVHAPMHYLQFSGVSQLQRPASPRRRRGEPLFLVEDFSAEDVSPLHPEGVLYRMSSGEFSFCCLSFYIA